MSTVNVHEAKTHFSKLLERVQEGEQVVIAKAGKPVARVVPLDAFKSKRRKRLGFMTGEIAIPKDFDSMGRDEIETMFGVKG